jgi:hypothetical protein
VLNKQSLRFVYDLNQTAGFCKYIVNQWSWNGKLAGKQQALLMDKWQGANTTACHQSKCPNV